MIEILMPALSPTMTEGNLAKWLKKEGDTVSNGDIIAEIETDKATMEVESVDEGILGKIFIKEGSEGVAVNSVIALLLEEGDDKKILGDYKIAEVKKEEKPAAKTETASVAPAPANPAPTAQPQQISQTPVSSTTINTSFNNESVIASPVAKKIASQNGVNLATIKGTGPKGRVVKEDVLSYLDNPTSSDIILRNPSEAYSVTNNNMRKVIANRLLESKQTIPHFYLTNDINIDSLLDLRVQVNSNSSKDENGKPTYKVSVNDLIIKATALALKKTPDANASWTNDAIIKYNNIDISIAVAIEGGLITPIVRNADQKKITAISKEMKILAAKAKSGTLAPEEFQGGGFSISNLGMYGIKQFNAIVNPPQSCILAVGGGEKRAIVNKAGNIVIANMMTVSISCDHRVVDGAIGANFLNSLKHYLENPATLLL